MAYLWERKNWPNFGWDERRLATKLAAARLQQGLLLGRMNALTPALADDAMLRTMADDVFASAALDGLILDPEIIATSVARRLVQGAPSAFGPADGMSNLVVSATRNCAAPLTGSRLQGWHAALFPGPASGAWRTDAAGPLQVVSGPVGQERVHFVAPPAARLQAEMRTFLAWFEQAAPGDMVLRAGIAHLWFATIHPFDDGVDCIARALADMVLARDEGGGRRLYSMATQLRRRQADYLALLEQTQKGDLDITPWLDWFVAMFAQSVAHAEAALAGVDARARFWERHAARPFTRRQISALNAMLDDAPSPVSSSLWAARCGCSQDSAHRDILDLVAKGVLAKDDAGGRSTVYSLVMP